MNYRNLVILSCLLFFPCVPAFSGLELPKSDDSETSYGFSKDHGDSSEPAKRDSEPSASATGEGLRKKLTGAFPGAENAFENLSKILSDKNKDPEEIMKDVASMFEHPDMTKTEVDPEVYRKLLESLPESTLNSPLTSFLRAKAASMTELKATAYELSEGKNSSLQLSANRKELASRLEKIYSLSPSQAKRIASLSQLSGGATLPPELLAKSFDLNPLRQMVEKLSMRSPAMREGDAQFAGNLRESLELAKEILQESQSKKAEGPIAFHFEGGRSTFQPEPQTGNFAASLNSLVLPQTENVAREILANGGTLTVYGKSKEEFDEVVKNFPEAQRKQIKFGESFKKPGTWATDYRGLPVKETASGAQVLLDAKYFNPYDDPFPTFEAKHAKMPVKPFDYHLEGGNIIGVPGKNGKPVVVVSDAYFVLNASKGGVPPEEAKAALKKQFADQAELVVVPGQQDGTGHVDMFMKPSSNGKTYIADYNPYLPKMKDGREGAERAQSRLNEAYRLLEPHVDLVKVPQIPSFGSQSFSKMNNLSFTKNGEKIYIVPDYPSHPLNKDVNVKMQRTIREREPNAKFRLVDGEELIQRMGSFHCVFPQVCY